MLRFTAVYKSEFLFDISGMSFPSLFISANFQRTAKPGREIASFNMSMFLSWYMRDCFSMASKNGFTLRKEYQRRKSASEAILFSSQTRWQYSYSSDDMLVAVREL